MPALKPSYLTCTEPRYHQITNRCSRGAYLCGIDPITGVDYSHRRRLLLERLQALDRVFAVELLGYAIVPERFDLFVFYDPHLSKRWSDEEVAERWLQIHPARARKGQSEAEAHALAMSALTRDPQLLARRRERLGSISGFLSSLKQPIARQANREERYIGRFFVQGVESRVVDLNAGAPGDEATPGQGISG